MFSRRVKEFLRQTIYPSWQLVTSRLFWNNLFLRGLLSEVKFHSKVISSKKHAISNYIINNRGSGIPKENIYDEMAHFTTLIRFTKRRGCVILFVYLSYLLFCKTIAYTRLLPYSNLKEEIQLITLKFLERSANDRNYVITYQSCIIYFKNDISFTSFLQSIYLAY